MEMQKKTSPGQQSDTKIPPPLNRNVKGYHLSSNIQCCLQLRAKAVNKHKIYIVLAQTVIKMI